MKDMKKVEQVLLMLGCASILLFIAGYFIKFLFIGFLLSLAAIAVVLIGFWKCPHCGRHLWINFDAPCKRCGKNVFDKPEEKPKNTEERTGFFGW